MRLKHFLSLVFIPLVLFASWYDQKLEGWYYFEDPTVSENPKPESEEEAEEFIASESKKLKQLLALALVAPTQKNVENYIRSQRYWVQQSNTFAQNWGKTILEHPELADFLEVPTSSYGILAKRDLDLKKRKDLLKNLGQDHFLIFFFNGKDPASEKVLEVVQLFSSIHDWKYKAVSLDGIGLPDFKGFEPDKGISKRFNVAVAPSIFAVDTTNSRIYPVGVGFVTLSEIERNIETQMADVDQ